MSAQPMLDFGGILAPSVIEPGSDSPESAQLSGQSRADSIPGHGRIVIVCERCGRRWRKNRRDARFCVDACRRAYLHEEQGQKEARKKARAMKGSAARNSEYLKIARDAARQILRRDGDADADRVRFLLESKGVEFPTWSGWSGSIFPSDPEYSWTAIGWVNAKHKASKNRPVRVWR